MRVIDTTHVDFKVPEKITFKDWVTHQNDFTFSVDDADVCLENNDAVEKSTGDFEFPVKLVSGEDITGAMNHGGGDNVNVTDVSKEKNVNSNSSNSNVNSNSSNSNIKSNSSNSNSTSSTDHNIEVNALPNEENGFSRNRDTRFSGNRNFSRNRDICFASNRDFSRNGGCFSGNRNSSSSSSNGGSGSSSSNGGSSKRRQAFEVDNVDQLGGEVVELGRDSKYPRRNSQLISHQCENSNDSIPVQNSLREMELTRQASEMSNQEVIDNAITFEEWENSEDMESLTVDESQRAARALIEDGIIQDSKRNTRTTNPATERIKVPKNLTTTFNDSTTSYVLPVDGHYLRKKTVIRCVSIAKINFDESQLNEETPTLKQAMNGPDRNKWIAAMEKQLNELVENGTWEENQILTDDPEIKARAVRTQWIFNKKRDGSYKARLF
ncbi:unnamed protein product [Ambrosiozyma monospora]|uniref:Unnamed protein product n=1 Tax=Ambrosiozyma monospora TaxID=43982 RepID=A0A9W6Z7X5_AMBMO|nr:unnamed protein product [Ambrosiozyma monospora]